MMPPIYRWLEGVPAVANLVGDRIFPFGLADQNTPYPYVTFQIISGLPEQYLGDRPDIDSVQVQVDCWGTNKADGAGGTQVSNVADAVRDVLEGYGHMVGFGSTERDPDTLSYRYRMDFEFWTPRG
jgi:hypothetical protein